MSKKNMESTRELMGTSEVTDYSIRTYKNEELVYFLIQPSNISVLSEESLSARIYGLMTVLKGITEIEMMCLNSRENFEDNKRYLKKRMEEETNTVVRKLLEKDANYLDRMQVQMATAREFLLIIRLREKKENEIFSYLNRIEKMLAEQGFTSKRAEEEDIKRILAVYFEQNVTVIQFYTDHYICGNTYRSVWALREYPTATDEQAILRHLGEKDGVTLRIYTRQVTPAEEKKIISNAANKNRMKQGNTENLQETVTAASNLQEVTTIIATMHRNREPLLHAAVFIELSAPDLDKLKLLQTEVLTELIRSKLNVDRLLLRQKQGFMCVHPVGRNVLGEQFERALPASSVANLFPFNYSGKTDKNGFYIGRDKFGSNVIVDFNQRADDKTNANILILGNSGQGKSYLLKLILTILRESGMKVICLDPEHEYIDLTNNLGGCFVDLMSGEYIINVLGMKTEVLKIWMHRWLSSVLPNSASTSLS